MIYLRIVRAKYSYLLWRIGFIKFSTAFRWQLIGAYPTNTWFHEWVCGLSPDVLWQLFNDIVMRGGNLIQTVPEWNAIPKQMGWKALNFCGQLNK